MNTTETLAQMQQLRLFGMYQAYHSQLELPTDQQLEGHDLIAQLLQSEQFVLFRKLKLYYNLTFLNVNSIKMDDFIIKGTLAYLSYEQWKNDPKILSSVLFSIIGSWCDEIFEPTGFFRNEYPVDVRKKYGEVRNADIALGNDIHNLSICYHQINYINDDETLSPGFNILYISNLVESYFSNLRSIYDCLAVFPRILVEHQHLKNRWVSTDSLNDLISFCEKDKRANDIFPEEVCYALKRCRLSLNTIRTIRDAIIHHGKDPVITVKTTKEILFRIPKNNGNTNENLLPDILNLNTLDYPLFLYLKQVTNTLLGHLEDIGNAIGNNLRKKRDGVYHPHLISLGGYCMPKFVEFLFSD